MSDTFTRRNHRYQPRDRDAQVLRHLAREEGVAVSQGRSSVDPDIDQTVETDAREMETESAGRLHA